MIMNNGEKEQGSSGTLHLPFANIPQGGVIEYRLTSGKTSLKMKNPTKQAALWIECSLD